jgi:hypothetical protein
MAPEPQGQHQPRDLRDQDCVFGISPQVTLSADRGVQANYSGAHPPADTRAVSTDPNGLRVGNAMNVVVDHELLICSFVSSITTSGDSHQGGNYSHFHLYLKYRFNFYSVFWVVVKNHSLTIVIIESYQPHDRSDYPLISHQPLDILN